MKFTHILFILLAVVSMILATATFIEHTNGHDVAVATIYTSWWMIVFNPYIILTSTKYLCGINMFVSAYFTALNNGLVSALAAFARTLVFELGAVFVLPLFLGLDGVWLAVDLADVLALIMSAILLTAAKGSFKNASL